MLETKINKAINQSSIDKLNLTTPSKNKLDLKQKELFQNVTNYIPPKDASNAFSKAYEDSNNTLNKTQFNQNFEQDINDLSDKIDI